MLLIKNTNLDARYNLALEEYLLKNFNTDETIVYFWQNKKAVIIGRYQDYYREINETFTIANNIQVVRRMSGGGAVYHDKGNVNFTFIMNNENISYEKAIEPIIKCLNSLGVPAIFSGRNDITVLNHKISGNAQYIHKNRLLHHGTLLFDVNLKSLTSALNPDHTKLAMKGISSVRARVTNIKDKLKENLSVEEFINRLEMFFLKNDTHLVKLEDSVIKEVNELKKQKYSGRSWNVDFGPSWGRINSNITHSKRFEKGLLGVTMQYIGIRIQKIHFTGDFLGKKDFMEFNNLFAGATLEDIPSILEKVKLSDYFGEITKDQVIELLNETVKVNKRF